MVYKTIGAIVALIALAACSGTGSKSSLPGSVLPGSALPGSGNSTVLTDSLASSSWQALSSKTVQPPSGSVAAFAFSTKTNSRLLITANDPSKNTLLGNHAGQPISATVGISGTNPTTTFTYDTTNNPCGTPASARLFFQSTGGPFAYTDYWWSDTAAATLASINNTAVTLTATLDPTTAWSDWNGQSSSGLAAAFTAAASNITAVGISFGGGCFFENGVGTSDGSGIFTLGAFGDGTRQ